MLVLVTCFSYTHMPVLVRCFSYTPHASFSVEFYNPDDSFSKVFLSVTLLVLVLVRCFSYAPDASFSEVFLLRTSC